MCVSCQCWCSDTCPGSFIVFYLHLPQSKLNLAQSQHLFLSRSIGSPQGCWHQSDLPSMISTKIALRILPHDHLQSFFLLLAIGMDLPGPFCFRGFKRNMSINRFSTSWHCCSAPVSTHYTGPGGHFEWVQGETCLLISVTLYTWKRVFLVGINMCYSNTPSNSHSDFLRVVAHMGIAQIGQISIALLRGHRARLLATAHVSVKTQT